MKFLRRLFKLQKCNLICLAGFVVMFMFYPRLLVSIQSISKDLEPTDNVDMQWGVKIPLRDGISLSAVIFMPASAHSRFFSSSGAPAPSASPASPPASIPVSLPVIFTFTPYLADTYLDRAIYFAQHGYVFALVDVRGRGNSEGKFEPYVNEGKDGYDVVEWLGQQPWSNGKVAMWGGSYAGFDQWTTLKEFPPHLVTIVPAAAAYPCVDDPCLNNIFNPYQIQWLTYKVESRPILSFSMKLRSGGKSSWNCT